jgi:hypothetical protein
MSSKVKLILAGIVAGVLLSFGAGALVHHLRWEPTPKPIPVPKPEPGPAPTPTPKPDWFGWSPHAAKRHEVAAQFRPFSAAARGAMTSRPASDTRPILLYKAWTDLFAGYPPYPAQQIGDCVSFGHAHATDLLQCIEYELAVGPRGPPPKPTDIQETDTEFLYGAAREAGGMLGGQDGCFGAAAVKAMTETGIVSRRMLGAQGVYSGQRAKQWGRTGPPEILKSKAAAFKLGSVAQVTTWDELVAALHNGNPVTICTARGFNLQRDSQGFCKLQGRWGHCMFIAGIRFDRPGACIIQSWGTDMPSGPLGLDQPSYSFWADRNAIEAILSEGDSWALSKSPNFGQTAQGGENPRRRLPSSWRRAA